ncbi:MAG: methyltransferase domain-containing protein [Ramlibacter sp.]|nr:methyltransferase domain-containing protein [Ramlibacter sp.]
MIERYRHFPFPLNVYAHLLVRSGCNLDWLHYGLFASENDSFAQAQAYSTQLLLERLVPAPARVLEVGTGMGATMDMLQKRGYEVTGVNPDPGQIAYANERFATGDRIVCSRWEDFVPHQQWDQVIFQESAQYIAPNDIFGGAARALKPGGKLLILDEVGLRRAYEGEPGLNLLSDYMAAGAAHGFTLDEHLDLSKLAAPTVDHMLKSADELRGELIGQVGATAEQIDGLNASNEVYREKYRDGRYGYARLVFTKGVSPSDAEPAAEQAPTPAQVLPAPGPMVLHIDYPVHPRVRFGAAWGQPVNEKLQAIVRSQDDELRACLAVIASYAADLQRIPATAPEEQDTPRWINGWLPGLDGAAIYAFLRDRKPVTYWEVGSGNSTKFARRAIVDGDLATRIVSIDPAPRAEIDAICDEVIRKPLEDAAAELIARVAPGDVCFIDCSHRAFQNSDVTVAMLEVLPALPPGVVVGFHDIFLPDDYPPTWLERYYNEQYLLAMYLLGGHAGTDIVLPSWDASRRSEMADIVAPIWQDARFSEVERHGDAFWLRVKP